MKPHLNFVAPKKYWDLYDRKEIRTSDKVEEPRGGAAMGLHASFELRTRHGIPKTGPIERSWQPIYCMDILPVSVMSMPRSG